MKDSEYKTLENAQAMLKKGDAAGALRLLRPFASSHPNDVDAQVALAEVLLAAGEGNEAMSVLSQSLTRAPNEERSSLLLASLEAMADQQEQALSRLDSLISARGISREGAYLKAAILLSSKVNRPSDALALLKGAVAQLPGPDDSLAELRMQAHLRLGDRKAAIAEAQQMLGRGTRSVDALVLLASEELAAGHAARVLESVGRLPDEATAHPLLAGVLAAAYEQQGDDERAATFKKRALAGVPAVFHDEQAATEWINRLKGESNGTKNLRN